MATKNKTQRAKAGKTQEKSYWQKMLALPVHRRLSAKLQKVVDRLGDYGKQAQRFDSKGTELVPAESLLSKLLAEGQGNVSRAIAVLMAIPENYVAPKRSGGTARAGKFLVGGLVQVREKRRAAYDLPDAEQLRIVDVRPHSLLVRTAAGAQLILPFGHVTAVSEATPAKAARS